MGIGNAIIGAVAGYFEVDLYRLGYIAAVKDAEKAIKKLKEY